MIKLLLTILVIERRRCEGTTFENYHITIDEYATNSNQNSLMIPQKF